MISKTLLACFLLACSGAGPLEASDAAPTVAIELVPAETQWEVRYALPKAAHELRFTRVDAQGNRAKSWIPVDSAFVIALENGEEVVRRSDGAAFDHAAFRMAPQYTVLEKDYAPFSP